MILTKMWLNEWINIKNIDSQSICDTLNSIGLEVDRLEKIRVPVNIVVGKILTCKKHPDADKLNICKIDLGDEVKQIVCGAKNVKKGQYVAVCKVGATLLDGTQIKEANLRGVDSSGMICSSQEMGLPRMGDGIAVLDSSIGELVLGKELREYELINDDIIEIELTANRGDCLSIHGVARDLSVPYALSTKIFSSKDDDSQLGVGRVLNLKTIGKIDASLLYRVYDKKEIKSPFLIDFRLAIADSYKELELDRIVEYSTYTTGVLLRAYSHACFQSEEERATIKIKKQINGLDFVINKGNNAVSIIGVNQKEESKTKQDDSRVILEANYTHPKTISINSANIKLDSDRHLYRSSRGSEPNLGFGMDYLIELLRKYSKIMLYVGTQEVASDFQERKISVNLGTLRSIIGEEIPKNRIIQILKSLEFDVVFKADQSAMSVKIPPHRHDIINIQDICEEIVRIVGINNIISKPLFFAECSRVNDSYSNFKKRKAYRYKAVGVGFFETLHFVFDNKERVHKYGLNTIYKKREIVNPITNELNTLRSSLIPNLLESVSRNVKFGKKSIKLFETGVIFDKGREESLSMAFVFSGEVESQKVSNQGKPEKINFFSFSDKISRVIGSFELKSTRCKENISSPYEYARVIIDSKDVGFVSRVHLGIEKELDLDRTYICELDLNSLPFEKKEVVAYSSFPQSIRDLSLIVPKNMLFTELEEFIGSIAPKEMVKFYPIDCYEDELLGDNRSLTVKFHFQSSEKTLEDEEVSKMVDKILESIKEKFEITLR